MATALLLGIVYNAAHGAVPPRPANDDGGAQEASTSTPTQPGNGGFKISKIKSGVVQSDDFNDGVLNTDVWMKMQHKEIFPAENDGYLVIKGTPSENAKGWWHAGAMTKRSVNKGLPDIVMAVKYLLPHWDYACTMDWKEFPIYEAHLCNDTPDINHSIRISRMCPNQSKNKALFGGLNEDQLPRRQIRTKGVEMFISYNDGKARAYILDKNGKAHAATAEVKVHLEDYKRMELKSIFNPPGVETFLKVDWAVLYPQPLDVPATIEIADPAATKVSVNIGEWKKVVPVTNGSAKIKLPANRIYPSAASVKVFKGNKAFATLDIPRTKDLGGLYPGDTWRVTEQ